MSWSDREVRTQHMVGQSQSDHLGLIVRHVSLQLVILEINRDLNPFVVATWTRDVWKNVWLKYFHRLMDTNWRCCIHSWFPLIEGLVRNIELQFDLSIVLNSADELSCGKISQHSNFNFYITGKYSLAVRYFIFIFLWLPFANFALPIIA